MNKINDCIEQVMVAVRNWSYHAQTAGVTEQTIDYIQKKIDINLSLFGQENNSTLKIKNKT